MPIQLEHDPAVADLVARTAAFVRDVVIPVEEQHRGVTSDESVRAAQQAEARDAGVFAPQVSPEYGGQGLDMRDRAPVFEEAGYSLLGPLALNIAAPDEGNMHMLEAIANDEQKKRYLRPLATGEVRSCFAMTEPAPGAGWDPSGIARRAQDIAATRAAEREAFGSRLADRGMIQQMIADNEIDIAATRGLVLHACWELDQGSSASQATSITKTFSAEAIWRVVDRSLQICGALGISGDVLLGRFLREGRSFRICDGSSETHRSAIARRVLRQQAP